MSSNRLVSVIIPTYNCGGYIGEAVESVLAQTYQPLEIIVVDNGSTDETLTVLARYGSCVRSIYENKRGPSVARNVGVQDARGECIAFLDADDIWLPTKLELQVQALERYPDAGLVFSDFLDFDDSGVTGSSRFSTWPGARAWFERCRVEATDLAYGSMYQDLLQANWIHTSSVLLKKAVLEEVGLFDEAYAFGEDYDLWLRIAQQYPVLWVNRVLTGYRSRAQSTSGPKELKGWFVRQGKLMVLEKHLRNKWIPESLEDLVYKELSQHHWALGWNLFGQNRLVEARSLFRQGLRYDPYCTFLWLYWCGSFLPVSTVEAVRRIRRWRRAFELHPEAGPG